MRRRTTRKTKPSAPRRRRSTGLRTTKARTRRVTRRSKGMLSEFFDAKSAQQAGMVVAEGALGGVGATLLGKVLPSAISAQQKAIITIGAGFVTASMFKRPIAGAGMASVGVVELLKNVNFLADNSAMWSSGMDSLPMVLNEGEAMYLSENYPLAENMYLSEDYDSSGLDYEVGYFPEFGGI
jgi:hypothetical protein